MKKVLLTLMFAGLCVSSLISYGNDGLATNAGMTGGEKAATLFNKVAFRTSVAIFGAVTLWGICDKNMDTPSQDTDTRWKRAMQIIKIGSSALFFPAVGLLTGMSLAHQQSQGEITNFGIGGALVGLLMGVGLFVCPERTAPTNAADAEKQVDEVGGKNVTSRSTSPNSIPFNAENVAANFPKICKPVVQAHDSVLGGAGAADFDPDLDDDAFNTDLDGSDDDDNDKGSVLATLVSKYKRKK